MIDPGVNCEHRGWFTGYSKVPLPSDHKSPTTNPPTVHECRHQDIDVKRAGRKSIADSPEWRANRSIHSGYRANRRGLFSAEQSVPKISFTPGVGDPSAL
jgi:hypothetical protein